MENALIYMVLTAVFGLFMAWGIGANDVANAMATSIGSRAITAKQALLVAGVFEFAGAVLAGGEVTSTIRKGIIDASSLGETPELLIYGMLAALLAAGLWLLLASQRGRDHRFRNCRHRHGFGAVGQSRQYRRELGRIAADRGFFRLSNL
jgi:PiT family inorganic phosphate transporter